MFGIGYLFFIRRWTFDVRCWTFVFQMEVCFSFNVRCSTFFFQNNLALMGQGIVETLSQDLQKEFPDMKGFSKENLWRMKKLYESYKSYPKLSPLVTELSWSHNLMILFQAQSIEEKEFYLKTCVHERWSRRELERQINSSLYERFMLSRKTDKLVPHILIAIFIARVKTTKKNNMKRN